MEKIKVLAVVGPTATGKTKLSVELAKIFNGEIISADSMQIYQKMNIGTAKPTAEEIGEIPYYLVDFLDISNTFSVAEYVKLAKNKIFDINYRQKLPIICGGTGLYVDSLTNNIEFLEEETDLAIREKLYNLYKKDGLEPLLKKLAKIDKDAFQKIHPNNVKRIIRAIEIYETSGITMTEQVKMSKKFESPFDTIFIGLDYKSRDFLYNATNKRVDEMVRKGLLEEVHKVLAEDCSNTAKSAIGYKEFIPYFRGDCTLESAIESLKAATRKYAKRQLTWFKRNKKITWFYIDEHESFENLLENCKNFVEAKVHS